MPQATHSLDELRLALSERSAPSEPAAAALHAFCQLCGLPHPLAMGVGGGRATQGAGCAFSAEPGGSWGRGHYGSFQFDDHGQVLVASEDMAQEIAGMDPVCDACLGQALLMGKMALSTPASTKEALGAALRKQRARDAELSREEAARLGRSPR